MQKPSPKKVIRRRFSIAFLNLNEQNLHKPSEVIEKPPQEPIQRHHITMIPTPWTRYDYTHSPSEAYKAFPLDAIVYLEALS